MATSFKSIGQRLQSWFTARKLRPIRKQAKRCRPQLEVLEDRTLPSVISAIGDVFYIDLENHNFTQPNGNVNTSSSTIEQIQGNPAAPYINSLITPGNPNAAMVSYATNYHNVMASPTGAPPTPNIHPSEPNYIWQEGGSNFGVINNDDDPYANNGNPDTTLNNNVKLIASTGFNPANLSALLQAKYGTAGWHSYQEDMQYTGLSVPTTSVSGTNGTVNPYNGSTQYNFAVKHDGTLFYTATNGGTLTGPGPSDSTNTEAAYYSPLGQLATDLSNNNVARYNLITPDQYNDMHTALTTAGFTYNGVLYTGDAANIAQGDNFLSKIIPMIEASAAFKNNGEIVIWNDESEAQNSTDTTPNDFNHDLTEIVISPLAQGNAYASTLNYTHSSDLKTLQEIFGVTGPSGTFLADANTPGTNDLSDLYRPTVSTVGTFNPATATWYLRNENSAGGPDAGQFQYGGPGWTPVVGDWNGDGTTTVGVVNPSSATWYLRNENSSGAPDVTAPFSYGAPGWTPVTGNWTGGPTAGVGMFDPSTATWYLRNEANGGAPDAGKFQYGGAGWIPVTGDWNGDGTTTIGVVNPATMTWYLRSSNSAGAPTITAFQYGAPGWIPVAGDWNHDGTTTIGVVDPTTGTWYLRNENSSGAPDAGVFQYGGAQWNYLAGQWQPKASLPPGMAEFAAGGALVADPGVSALTNAQLQQTVSAALTRLEAAGIGQALLSRLEATTYVVGQLPQGLLGYTYAQQQTVVISPTAAGNGWFVDPTPLSDAEFTPDATGALTAAPGSSAAGRMDLMTVVLHEMGHVAGYSDVNTQSNPNNLMDATLGVGVRRTAGLDVLFANAVS